MEHNGLVVLNEVGAEVWKLLATGKNIDEITAAIAEDYDAETDVIRRDVQDLIQKFINLGFLLDE